MGNKKIGHPTDNPKDIVLKIRIDKDTDELLGKCCETLNTSKAEIVRRGIKKMFDDLEK